MTEQAQNSHWCDEEEKAIKVHEMRERTEHVTTAGGTNELLQMRIGIRSHEQSLKTDLLCGGRISEERRAPRQDR